MGPISLMLALPVVTALLVYLLPKKASRWIAIIGTLATLAISASILVNFDIRDGSFKFIEQYKWIPSIGASVLFGVDGLSLVMVLLSTSLFFIAILVSGSLVHEKLKLYYTLFLLLETFVLGVFVSLDLMLFYIFWDLVIAAMFFLILIWGGSNKRYASIKFIIYTGAASFILLLSIIGVYMMSGASSFDIRQLTSAVYPQTFGLIAFIGLFFAFIVKMPIFPFHTWLPDAHVEAPSPASVILAGLLLKMGAYGLIRVAYSMFPNVASSLFVPIAALAGISIIYGAAVAVVQKDLKRMIAFSSIAHMGMVLLGIASMNQIALTGAIFAMFSHGIVSAMGFSMAGFIHEKIGTRIIGLFSGLASSAPRMGWTLLIVAIASFGIPTTSAFPAELMIVMGAFSVYGYYVLIPIIGILILAGGFLFMVQKSSFNNPSPKKVKDMSFVEYLPFIILLIMLFFFGLYPQFLVYFIDSYSKVASFIR